MVCYVDRADALGKAVAPKALLRRVGLIQFRTSTFADSESLFRRFQTAHENVEGRMSPSKTGGGARGHDTLAVSPGEVPP